MVFFHHEKCLKIVLHMFACSLLAGCMNNVGRIVTPPKTGTGSTNTSEPFSFPTSLPMPQPGGRGMMPPENPKVGGSKNNQDREPHPKETPASDILNRIRPDKLCKVPEENYNFTDTLRARIGSEGVLRLNKLFESDFKRADLSKKEREYLKTLAKEMLWIPASIEEQIGNAMLNHAGENMDLLEDSADNEDLWDNSTRLVGNLISKAPRTPFQTRLVIVQKGEPQSLAGGLIFIDAETIKAAFDSANSSKQVEKLNFIVAHELAHIYKRHRAKRLQQLLVDTDTGLKLVRSIFGTMKKEATRQENGNLKLWAQTLILIPDVVDLYRKHNARYEQDQEFEADTCATALMISASAGNPVSAFKTYEEDQIKHAKKPSNTDLYASHPPNSQRADLISTKYKSFVGSTRDKSTTRKTQQK